jgi:hypothetical protein
VKKPLLILRRQLRQEAAILVDRSRSAVSSVRVVIGRKHSNPRSELAVPVPFLSSAGEQTFPPCAERATVRSGPLPHADADLIVETTKGAPPMKLVALLALAITLLAGSENTADSGYGIDPNGSTQSSQSSQSNDIGCGIDPNGCNG